MGRCELGRWKWGSLEEQRRVGEREAERLGKWRAWGWFGRSHHRRGMREDGTLRGFLREVAGVSRFYANFPCYIEPTLGEGQRSRPHRS